LKRIGPATRTTTTRHHPEKIDLSAALDPPAPSRSGQVQARRASELYRYQGLTRPNLNLGRRIAPRPSSRSPQKGGSGGKAARPPSRETQSCAARANKVVRAGNDGTAARPESGPRPDALPQGLWRPRRPDEPLQRPRHRRHRPLRTRPDGKGELTSQQRLGQRRPADPPWHIDALRGGGYFIGVNVPQALSCPRTTRARPKRRDGGKSARWRGAFGRERAGRA